MKPYLVFFSVVAIISFAIVCSIWGNPSQWIVFSHNQSNTGYVQKLWNAISQGDITSEDCMDAVNKYQEQNLLAMSNHVFPTLANHLYIYSKQRCLGLLEQNDYDGNTITGDYDEILDLVTNTMMVECTSDFTDGTASCDDGLGDSWSYSSGQKISPPYPLYTETWVPLNTLSSETGI